MSGFESLDPAIQHHIVNTLGWPGLRPLQEESIPAIVGGGDALLLAPTAGGKTEAAVFPVLTRMQEHRWAGTSVLYVCPLKALLNNLGPRLADYAAWVGRSASVWHGDVSQAARRGITRDRPDILLTTPESLESMLVSESVDAQQFLGDVRTVIVDEVHAFAGDDRGWHLLAVLARLESLISDASGPNAPRRRLQRIGMSATVGNPDELLRWLRGGAADGGRVVAPEASAAVGAEITVDAVGSAENAATVIAGLHRGEKRLVFVDSRRLAEELGTALRSRGITTFISHSSLSAQQRRESEAAFAEARDCVIVATSTLELGIDVGDLDRVIQINSPRTVSSFLQRLGRTGRRPGTTRNCLFLALDDASLAQTLGMLHCWRPAGWSPWWPLPSLATSLLSRSSRRPCRPDGFRSSGGSISGPIYRCSVRTATRSSTTCSARGSSTTMPAAPSSDWKPKDTSGGVISWSSSRCSPRLPSSGSSRAATRSGWWRSGF